MHRRLQTLQKVFFISFVSDMQSAGLLEETTEETDSHFFSRFFVVVVFLMQMIALLFLYIVQLV